MMENLFEIVDQNKSNSQQESSNLYPKLLQQFIHSNYGFYTQMFIQRLAQQAQSVNGHCMKVNIKSLLRQVSKKYLLNDLQIVFMGFFCGKNQWGNSFIQASQNYSSYEQDKINDYLIEFLEFNAYFIKSYIGNIQQFKHIEIQLGQRNRIFFVSYQKWVKAQPLQNFRVDPRQINLVYGLYSQGCQNISSKNNYNDMVNNIIDLSATYSIMAGPKDEKAKKQKKSAQIKEQTIKNEKNSVSQLQSKYQAKQSILQCLDSLSKIRSIKSGNRLSGLQKKEEQNQLDQKQQRSRDKNPARKKVSLNFKKKQQQNNPVLDLFNQKYATEYVNDNYEGIPRDPNRSYLEMNLRDIPNPGVSWLDLRLNRSNQSSGLPMLWKPSDGGFFDKSHLN